MAHPLLRVGMHRCPAHEDRSPSLSVSRGTDGRWLLKCHAGCATEDVLDAAGLSWADVFPTALPPRDPHGYRPTWRQLAVLRAQQHEERARRKRDQWRLAAWVSDEDRDTWHLIQDLRAQATQLGDQPIAWGLLDVAQALEAGIRDE